MKKLFKSAAIIFSAAVMTFMSGTTAYAERRNVMNDKDRFLWDYINEDESHYIRYTEVNTSERYYRKTEDGKTCSRYDFNMDGVTDISDAQAALNEYTMIMSLGNPYNMPETLYNKYNRWSWVYRQSLEYPLMCPEDDLVYAQLMLKYYTAKMTGNDYVRRAIRGTDRTTGEQNVVIRWEKEKAGSFYDWIHCNYGYNMIK